MKLTEQQLLRIFPNARLVAGVFVAALQRAMDEREIDTPARRAALAQVGHESSQLTRLVENLNYSAQGLAATWPSRYLGPDGQPNALALRLARNPQAIADNTYATRNGNGDEASGDGWRFRGRGLLQITGRANYRLVGEALGEPGSRALAPGAARAGGPQRRLVVGRSRAQRVGRPRRVRCHHPPHQRRPEWPGGAPGVVAAGQGGAVMSRLALLLPAVLLVLLAGALLGGGLVARHYRPQLEEALGQLTASRVASGPRLCSMSSSALAAVGERREAREGCRAGTRRGQGAGRGAVCRGRASAPGTRHWHGLPGGRCGDRPGAGL